MRSNPNRVLLLGSPGAGKTTTSKLLVELTDLPLYHMDDLYWGADWARPDQQEWLQRLQAVVETDRWIIDGNYARDLAVRMERAQLAVVIDVPPRTATRRILTRAFKIRFGSAGLLPAAVEAQKRQGVRVRSTRDLPALLKLAWGFRRDVLPHVVAEGIRARVPVVVVSSAEECLNIFRQPKLSSGGKHPGR